MRTSKDFPLPHIFSDLNGNIPSVYILEHLRIQMKPIEFSSSLLSRQRTLMSLHDAAFTHTPRFKIPVSEQILAPSSSSRVPGEMPGSWKRQCRLPRCLHCSGHKIPASARRHKAQKKSSATNAKDGQGEMPAFQNVGASNGRAASGASAVCSAERHCWVAPDSVTSPR